MLSFKPVCVVALLAACSWAAADPAKSFDAAAAFGARPSVGDMSLSPDGKSVAYITPTTGQGSVLITLKLGAGDPGKRTLSADGKPLRLQACRWVSSDRLVCFVYALVKDAAIGLMPVTRVLAVNADGSNQRELTTRTNEYSRGLNLYGGGVVDWLPEEDGSILMARAYLPDDHIGSHLGSSAEGLGVDKIDTRTLAVKHIEAPNPEAVRFFSDGHGTIRVMATRVKRGQGMDSGIIHYSFRLNGSREWRPLSNFNEVDGSGMEIYSADRDLNVAYGFKKKDGRRALYSTTLDYKLQEELVYERPDVDVDDLIQIGRRRHVVGASYDLETPQATYFEPTI